MVSLRLLSLSAFVLAAASAASAATVTFDCSKVPNICSNDCYALKCAGKPSTLHRNSAAATDNRNHNACKSPNRCSGNPDDSNSCDEYPYASTSEGGAGAVTRCVPAHENSVQGGTLSSFYTRSNVQQGDAYNVAFTGTSGLQYCGGSCSNSGNEVQRRGMLFNKRQQVTLHAERRFKLENGAEILMFEPIAKRGAFNSLVGQTVHLNDVDVKVVEAL
ncbi:hypothetical protein IE81DRAFT_320832 [Ceraceosorus guamensis]|uniref:Deoxyribonuclease NucA/NucB domain-containing protein n=1 Tax=Ceraceosorus guamensis TaxID=1522189 RepID=A0A316W566_9BASI|nr:hypothetical protein IE81DRAFT_320832 [Ceraceosorus guamensis]PWN44862.1 hypothetical protein IE81DRAFT_320832 [Ceraceosorus guamensis]